MTGLGRRMIGNWGELAARITLGFAILSLPACSVAEDDPTPDYRYRLTVEVDTPEGLRSGSSVIEIRQTMGRSTMGGFSEQVSYRNRGEAVAVDVADEQTLYALLRSDSNVQWAALVVPILAPDAGDENLFDDVFLLEGKHKLRRTYSPLGRSVEYQAWPMFVTFDDEADPTSVERVDPDDLAASFGEGVSLKRITVQMTDDPVTRGIEERLGWLADLAAYRTDPENPFSNKLPREIGGLRSR